MPSKSLVSTTTSFFFEPENSAALGFGFCCGFLGLLHMEIIQERLEREYELDLITTAPGVRYHINMTDGSEIDVDNPTPAGRSRQSIDSIRRAGHSTPSILTNEEYVGGILKLVEEKRGKQLNFEDSVTPIRVMLTLWLPLDEIVLDFYDRLKSISREAMRPFDYQLGRRIEVSPMVQAGHPWCSGEPVDALSIIVHRDFAYERGKLLVSKNARVDPPAAVSRWPSRQPSAPKISGPRNGNCFTQKRTRQMLWRRRFRASVSCWKNRRKARNG